MCPPVSPHKGASIVKFPAHNVYIFGMETPLPARVAPQGRIHRSFPARHACIFGMETPLRGRSGGHIGTAPTVSFGWITRKRLISFGWIARKWLISLGWIVRK